MTNASPPVDEAALDAAWQARCGLLYRAWVQLRYHRRRQRFFDLADKLTKSLTVLLGASLVGQHVQQWLPLVASAISGLGLLALVFGYGDRKQQHKELAESAAALIGEIERKPAGELSAATVAQWGGEFARLLAKAPPQLKALTLICEHEQSTADGHPSHVARPHLARRAMAQFW